MCKVRKLNISFTAFTSLPNGETEGHTFNDEVRKDFFIAPDIPEISEFFEGFEGDVFPPDGWTVNLVSIAQWGITPLVHLKGGNSLARSNYIDLFENEFTFELPKINISGDHNTELKFDYAYATSPGQSKHESFPLSEYEGNMLIRFTAVNGFGNNLYIDNLGIDMLTSISENNMIAAIRAFPNPFTASISLTCPLEEPSQVSLRMYDSYDRLVAGPANEYQQKGVQNAIWLPSGVYFVRLQTDNMVEVRKVIK